MAAAARGHHLINAADQLLLNMLLRKVIKITWMDYLSTIERSCRSLTFGMEYDTRVLNESDMKQKNAALTS